MAVSHATDSRTEQLAGAVRSAFATAKRDIEAGKEVGDAALDSEDEDEFDSRFSQMMRTVQMIGGAVIGIAIVTIVVNEVLTTSAVNNSSGPFGGVISSLETTGVAAMSLLVVGLLVAAASKLMSFFGGGF
jgi:hypothetical protein